MTVPLLYSTSGPTQIAAVPLKHLCSLNARVLSETTSGNFEFDYVDIGSVNSIGTVSSLERMTFERAPSRARRLTEHTDTLVSTVRTYLRAIGPAPESSVPVVASTGFAVLSPGPLLEPRYLSYAARSEPFVQEVCARSQGVSYPATTSTEIGEIPLSPPPLTTQTAIANFLDRKTAAIDELIEKKQKLLTLLAEKRAALINQAVTKGLDPTVPMKDSGIPWIGEIPSHWDVARVADICSKVTNGFVGPTRGLFVPSGVPYLQSLHIKNNEVVFDSNYFVTEDWSRQKQKSVLRAGDVLIVQTGDIGQVAVVPPEFDGANCHALIIISPIESRAVGSFISWTLNSEYGYHALKSIQTGALHPHLNCIFVREIRLPIPPVQEQSKISGSLNDIAVRHKGLRDAITHQVAQLREYRQALITAAVTGQLDIEGAA